MNCVNILGSFMHIDNIQVFENNEGIVNFFGNNMKLLAGLLHICQCIVLAFNVL